MVDGEEELFVIVSHTGKRHLIRTCPGYTDKSAQDWVTELNTVRREVIAQWRWRRRGHHVVVRALVERRRAHPILADSTVFLDPEGVFLFARIVYDKMPAALFREVVSFL